MISKDTTFGYGVYPISEAARIVGVSTHRAKRWLDANCGIVIRRYDPSEDTVSFLELMELLFIKLFRNESVSLQTIRKAAEAAAVRFETDYPFAVKRFDTDGKTIFATLLRETDDEELIEDLRRGQYVFRQIIRPFFRNLDYGEQEALRYWPLTKKGRVILDPDRKLGQPLDAQSGVPTGALYSAFLANGQQNVSKVAKWFDVPKRAVEQAILYEKSLA